MDYSLCLAHLSDLHFGKNSRFESKNSEELGKECGQTIAAATSKSFGKQRPDIVVVTGDITQEAGEAEFGQALDFFRYLSNSLGIPPSAFVFVPGNHDLSWQACQDYFTANPDKRDLLEYDPRLEQKKFERFSNFKVNFYGKHEQPAIIALERGAALYPFSEKRLCIAALNSCEQETEKRPGGTISKDQADMVMDHLRRDYPDQIKIVALHHPVNSTSDKTKPWIDFLKGKCETGEMTSELFERFCNDALSVEGNDFITAILEDCRVHLVLHGHQHSYAKPHQHQWRKPGGSCQICPAGSLGLKPDKLPRDQPNCLRLHHLFEKNARLQLKTVSLEYDPLERLEGVLTAGCFRDTGRRAFEASFPLPPGLRSWTASTDDSGNRAEADDNAFIASIQDKVEAILSATPELRKVLGQCLDEIEEARPLAKALIGKGLVKVWGEVTVHRRSLINHFDQLQRVLFLLAQCAIKSEAIAYVRKQMDLHEEVNVFELPIRYALMAELILKAAIQSEISVIVTPSQGCYNALPANMVPLPAETGIDANKAREYLEEKLCDKLILKSRGLDKSERFERLKGALKAYFIDRQPFFFVHSFSQHMEFPYLVEFLVPPENQPVPPDSVTPINEDTLCTLIKIILTTTSQT